LDTRVSRAAVAVRPKTTELREFALPELPEDAGLLRVEATGICGSDWGMYLNEKPGPRILGHEMVGIVEAVGPAAAARWGVVPGDRIASSAAAGRPTPGWPEASVTGRRRLIARRRSGAAIHSSPTCIRAA
jgi:D-arabinose 1-dehydrogenase-like Zn-dependent alcohol dehydrogenase